MSRLERMQRWIDAPQPRRCVQLDPLTGPDDYVRVISTDGAERLYTSESPEPPTVYQGESWAVRLGNTEWAMRMLDRDAFRKARQIARKGAA